MFAQREAELYIPVPMIVSAFSCSLICLLVKQNAGYWCAWAAAAPVVVLTPYFTATLLEVSSVLQIAFGLVMALAAWKLFSRTRVVTGRKQRLSMIAGWAAWLGLRILVGVLIMHSIIYSVAQWLPYMFLDLLSYAGMSFLLKYTVCYICSQRENKGP